MSNFHYKNSDFLFNHFVEIWLITGGFFLRQNPIAICPELRRYPAKILPQDGDMLPSQLFALHTNMILWKRPRGGYSVYVDYGIKFLSLANVCAFVFAH